MIVFIAPLQTNKQKANSTPPAPPPPFPVRPDHDLGSGNALTLLVMHLLEVSGEVHQGKITPGQQRTKCSWGHRASPRGRALGTPDVPVSLLLRYAGRVPSAGPLLMYRVLQNNLETDSGSL